jgi:hypothetical protein
MKLFKQLNAYKIEETEGAYLGFGCLRAKDYEKDFYGKLLLFSINIKGLKVIKKLFIRTQFYAKKSN